MFLLVLSLFFQMAKANSNVCLGHSPRRLQVYLPPWRGGGEGGRRVVSLSSHRLHALILQRESYVLLHQRQSLGALTLQGVEQLDSIVRILGKVSQCIIREIRPIATDGRKYLLKHPVLKLLRLSLATLEDATIEIRFINVDHLLGNHCSELVLDRGLDSIDPPPR